MNAAVYVIVNLVNGKTYVGKANNAQKRWTNHLSAARSKSPRSLIARAIRKHGSGNFRFDVLAHYPSEEEALRWEGWWISFFESNVSGKGYNLDAGGHGGKTLTAETRARISDALRGRCKSAAHVANMSKAASSRAAPSAEVVERRAASNRGRQRTPEQKRRIAEAKKGVRFSEEQRAHMAAAHRGNTHSAETRAKMAASQRARFKDGT